MSRMHTSVDRIETALVLALLAASVGACTGRRLIEPVDAPELETRFADASTDSGPLDFADEASDAVVGNVDVPRRGSAACLAATTDTRRE